MYFLDVIVSRSSNSRYDEEYSSDYLTFNETQRVALTATTLETAVKEARKVILSTYTPYRRAGDDLYARSDVPSVLGATVVEVPDIAVIDTDTLISSVREEFRAQQLKKQKEYEDKQKKLKAKRAKEKKEAEKATYEKLKAKYEKTSLDKAK